MKSKINKNHRKNLKKKLLIFAFLFFVLHLILQFSSILYSLASTMPVFDNPDIPEADYLEFKGKIAEVIYLILSFPILTILMYLFPYSQNWFEWFPFFGWTPFILNSLLWSLVFYFIIKRMYLNKNKIWVLNPDVQQNGRNGKQGLYWKRNI